MRVITLLALGFINVTAIAFGQLDSNSVTVSATRSTTVQPDQVVFAVYLDSGINTGFSDVLGALAPAGITATNFSGVSTQAGFSFGTISPTPPVVQPAPARLEWAFGLPVPLARMKETVTMLTNLQQNIAQQKNGMTLTFSVQGAQISPQLQQSQTCSIPDLLADARAQAQKLADASGMILGPILAMSSATSTSAGNGVVAVSRLGAFTSSTLPSFPPICTVTVKYGVSRY